MTRGPIQRGDGSHLLAKRAVRPRRLAAWWIDDPANPGRASLDNLAVQRLAAELAPGSRLSDLGGTMSLNVYMDPAGLVLRVHQPFVSRQRLLALQAIRRALADQGVLVPVPVQRRGVTIFRCGGRLAELETYLPHMQPEPTTASYAWLFAAIGRLHHALVTVDMPIPRPVVATYAPPGSLARWLRVTEAAIAGDAGAASHVQRAREVLRRLRRCWIPAKHLPTQLVHGDMRLGNVCRGPAGDTVFLDFGFLARRPRVHDLAYAIAFMLLALNQLGDPATGWRGYVPSMIRAYESTAHASLTPMERESLAVYTAAVPTYFMALAGLSNDPVDQLLSYQSFLRLSEWLLTHEISPSGHGHIG